MANEGLKETPSSNNSTPFGPPAANCQKELSAEKEEKKKNPCFPTARARPGSSFARVLLGLIMLPSLEKSLVDSPHVVGRGAEKKCECAMAAFSVTNKTFRGGYLEI